MVLCFSVGAFVGFWLQLKKDGIWGLNLQRGRLATGNNTTHSFPKTQDWAERRAQAREWILGRSSTLSSDEIGKKELSMMGRI